MRQPDNPAPGHECDCMHCSLHAASCIRTLHTWSHQEGHSNPLLLLYPICQFPCHWLEIKVGQQLICMIVSHHPQSWLASAESVYLQDIAHLNKMSGSRLQHQITVITKDAVDVWGKRACTNAVSMEGANVRNEWNSGMASVTCTDECPSCVLDAKASSDASVDERPRRTPLTADEGNLAE